MGLSQELQPRLRKFNLVRSINSSGAREARLRRRQLRRRVGAAARVVWCPARAGLLPTDYTKEQEIGSEQRHRILNNLDVTLTNRYRNGVDQEIFAQMPLYALRKKPSMSHLRWMNWPCFLPPEPASRLQSNRKDVKKKTKDSEDQDRSSQQSTNLNRLSKRSAHKRFGDILPDSIHMSRKSVASGPAGRCLKKSSR